MTAKTILALAQAHRREPSKANYDALADAVRLVVAERDAMRAELFRQVALVEKCMVSMNENADRRQKAEAEVARLTPLQFRQAPCHKFCEANAYEIELRGIRAELVRFTEFSKLAGRALNEAWAVVGTVEGESYAESESLALLLESLRELTHQAYALNGVMTAGQLKAAEGKS